jgi:phosphotriesterase-related protein
MGTVMTVLGPVESDSLGKTLTHEHIFCDFTCFLLKPKNAEEAAFMEEPVSLSNLWSMRINPYANRDNCFLNDMELAIREIEIFKKHGGETITEVTLDGIGRDVLRLADVSKKTGVNIIAATGHYIFETHPDIVRRSSSNQLADFYIDEIHTGIGDTGIRPGIIGEIGTSYLLHPEEVKVLRGAARAQRETNLAITIHLDPGSRRGHEVLDILVKEEGVQPDRIILGHTEFALAHKDIETGEGLEYILSLADRGCYIEFELCGNTTVYKKEKGSWVLPTDFQRTKAIAKLCLNGYSDRVLLSHDIGIKHFLREYGGWGYSHVLTAFQSYLEEAGIEPHTAKRFIIDNPACVLSVK